MLGNLSPSSALRCFVFTLMGWLTMASAPIQAWSLARPVILLSCPTTGQADSLCQAMIQALAEVGNNHVIRRVERGAEVPQRPGDLGVVLVVRVQDQRGHLEWRSPDGTLHTTPALSVAQVDARAVARDLVASDPTMLAVLKHPARP